MTQFNVGDRVRYTGNYSPHLKDKVGVVTPFFTARNVEVDWGGDWGALGVFPENIEIAEPRKDTPSVGDTVRVVLEGKVEMIGECSGHVYLNEREELHFARDDSRVKSIEIIEKAKPSVTDLPAWAVVKNKDTGEVAQRQGSSDSWQGTEGEGFLSYQLDRVNWVHLVEKTDD